MILLAVPALAATAYFLLAVVAAFAWGRPRATSGDLPPLSILKPMHGTDRRLYQAIRSQAAQDYPEFEILFGFGNAGDAAVADVERLQREFPERAIRVVIAKPDAPNAKVSVLAELARQARYPLLVVSDDDIAVGPGYLKSVAACFGNARTGLVTCLYRAHAESAVSLVEALGIATEFAPSVLVARLLGMADFALGSTMALRASTLQEIGGFQAIAGYLADDYQLGRHVTARGYRVEFSPAVVETGGGPTSWNAMWRHQLRWARTVRVSQRAGYVGSVVTQASFWAVIAFAGGQWWAGTAALAARILAGLAVGGVILKDRNVWRWFWLMPLRDLFGFAVWVGGCFGDIVYWRGRKLRLRADGRISEAA